MDLGPNLSYYSVSPWQQQISIGNRGCFGQVTTRRGRPRHASNKIGREAIASPLSQAKLRLSGQFKWAKCYSDDRSGSEETARVRAG
jgi:hypothetical protein